jgi:hypothetical protein
VVAATDIYDIDYENFEDMGDHFLQITSPTVDQVDNSFALFSETVPVIATADLSGAVEGASGGLVQGIILPFFIDPLGGPYDTVFFDFENRIPFEVLNSEFSIPDLALGDYLLLTDADDDELYIPTYFSNTEDWQNADTLFFRQDVEVNNYAMVLTPGALAGEAQLSMLVESNFTEETESGSRIEARRRVKKAGCSLRRRIGSGGGGRTDQEDQFELIAYKETDDNGEVSFGNLPVGLYRINIQYPGIPVDPDSFTEFEIREGEERSDISVSATITEDAITIELVNFITAFEKYFRNLTVYPNPASEYFMIRYDRLLSDKVKAKLTDLQGKLIRDVTVEKGYGIEKKIEIEGMEKGVYFLYFYDPEFSEEPLSVFKVIISK